jgi:glutathione synthase/RimK-type ligase-like ATP-grasp enzyme
MKQYKVIEINSSTEIVREVKNLNIYQAEETFFKILNTNPVKQGYNSVKIIKQ